MDSLREELLAQIQGGFPLESNPYGALAARLGVGRDEALEAVAALRREGVIRRMGASFSSAKLGYASTLCALSVLGGQAAVDAAAAVVDAYPHVTHDYLRDDARYNLWFTLITRDAAEKARILNVIRTRTGCSDLLDLPASALYKIRVDFGEMDGHGSESGEAAESKDLPAPFNAADPFDVALVRWAQDDIAGGEDALDPEPFATAADILRDETGDASVDEQRVLDRLRDLKQAGAIRRFGAMVAHRKLGYSCNGMTVWDVAPERCDVVGGAFAAQPFVSHCYARPRVDTWPYNLYAMVHAKSRDELDERVSVLEALAGLPARVLVSTKEYKKRSMRYFE